MQPELSPKNLVLSLGAFDGIHLGHKLLINQLVQMAKQKKAFSALCVFDPLPFQVLNHLQPFKRLFTISEMKEILKEFKLDFLLVLPFNKEISLLNPHDFLHSYLITHFQPQGIIVGYDFSFAYQKQGDFSFLKTSGKKHGFFVKKAPVYLYEKEPVSSSRVRKHLSLGEMEEVKKLLGRPFSIQSKVIEGEKRGRRLGFQTANLKLSNKQYPCLGVYAGSVRLDQALYKVLVNIGYRPTFYKNSDIVVEAHIPKVKKSLYNQELKLELEHFIRQEKKFSNALELKKQIQKDIEKLETLR